MYNSTDLTRRAFALVIPAAVSTGATSNRATAAEPKTLTLRLFCQHQALLEAASLDDWATGPIWQEARGLVEMAAPDASCITRAV